MGCVNKSSKEFKALAAKHGLSENTMELLIHKYWLQRGSEDLFPSDVYIQAQLNNDSYVEPISDVRKVWNKFYSHAVDFSSLESVKAACKRALDFFPDSSVMYYNNNKGGFTLSIRRPVPSITYSKKAFFRNKDYRKGKTLNLNLEENKVYTVDDIEALFNRFNTDRTNKALADRVFKIAKVLDLDIQFTDSLPSHVGGRYGASRVRYKKSFFEDSSNQDKKANVLLHELIHAVTSYTFNNEDSELTEPLKKFRNDMMQLFDEVKDRKELAGQYGTRNVEEFTAELSNPVFRKKLQSLDNKSLWNRILDVLRALFGIKSDSTYYNRAMTALDNALSAFDLDSFLGYYDNDTLLRQWYYLYGENFRDMSKEDVREAVLDYYRSKLPLRTKLSKETRRRLGAARDESKKARNNFLYPTASDDTGAIQDSNNQDRIKDFRNRYGDLIKSIVPFSNTNGGVSFSVTFKSPAELLQMENADNLAQLDMVREMSDDDLLSELALMEQEWYDFKLTAPEDIRDSLDEEDHRTRTQDNTPQTFTFNDGTTVRAPFKPNAQQAAALNAMNDFVNSDETSMTLSGYAGTGKTSLMEMFANKMRKEFKPVLFSASTNKAAAVLKAKVGKAGFDAKTLNKVFGISVEVDSTKAYNQRNMVNVIKDANIPFGATVIIDEASMINEENYNILNTIAKENNLKIVYVGDKGQLAPVNENLVSKVFRNGDGKIIELTQVERTGDNAILKEATDRRNGKHLSGVSSFNDRGEGVAFIPKSNKAEIENIIKHYVKGLRTNPDYFRILAYTNKAIAAYNTAVRKALGYEGYIPQVGEPMSGYSNWGYNWKEKTYRFINSESYSVVKVGKPRKVSTGSNDGSMIEMEAIPITLENSLGERDTFNFMDIKGNAENRKAAIRLAEEKKRLWEKARRYTGRQKGEILQEINGIDQFLFVNDNIEDAQHHLLQSKTIDFGYALTVHKSQGSTFTHVLMDDVDISIARDGNTDMSNVVSLDDDPWSATNDAENAIAVGEKEDVDLGDLSSVLDEAPTDQVANIRQQLEYVGVSRATNTVTVLSDNVKKEDSPLNHRVDNSKVAAEAKAVEDAHNEVVETLGNDAKAQEEVKDTVQIAKTSMTFDKLLEAVEPIFTKEEQEQLKQAMDGKPLVVCSVSRSTDPAFYSKQIVEFLEENAKKPLTDPTRVNAMEIWSKHDGLPMKDILLACKKYKVAPMVSFSITGMGGTALEQGVMKHKDLLNLIHNLVKDGTLNPSTTTIRIDPILIGETKLEDIKEIVETAKGMGIKKFVTSLVQSYGYMDGTPRDRHVTSGINEALASEGKTYDWDKYYGRDRLGKINFKPKQQYIDEVGKFLIQLKADNPDIKLETCAFTIKGLKASACLDPFILERITGVDIVRKDGTYDRDTSRPDCMCYGAHGGRFVNGTVKGIEHKKCYSSCAYCYASHSGDNKLNYYNEDGTLKRNRYTTTDYDFNKNTEQAVPNHYTGNITPTENTIFVFGSNPEGRHGAGAAKVAREQFGAIYGQGEGLQGNAYALPTKDLRVKENRSLKSISREQIIENIKKLYQTAKENPTKQFKVAYRNKPNETSLNGYTGAEMIEMFKAADPIPSNIYFSEEWVNSGLFNNNSATSSVTNSSMVSKPLQDAVSSGNWSDETTELIDKVLSNETDRKILFERFPQRMDKEIHGILGEAETIVSGGYKNSDSSQFRDRTEQFQARQAEGRQQEQAIETWAKHEGLWFNDYTNDKAQPYPTLEAMLSSEYEENLGGSEAQCYIDKETKEFVKAISLLHCDDNVQIALDRVIMHNHLFPNTAYTIIGFGRDSLGQFRIIVKQKTIQGENASPEEISEFAKNQLGLKEEQGWWYSNDGNIKITDLTPLNVLKDVNGEFQIIDCDIFLTSQSDALFAPEEFEPHAVSLPNFESFRSLNEELVIDAEWKIPLLQELDEQISDKNIAEDNADIADRMQQILDAESKDDIENPVTEQQKRTRRELDEFERLNKQIDNLLDSNLITASEIRHTAELIVNEVSDEITRLQQEEGLAKKQFGSRLHTTIDFQKATRREIVEAVGLDLLLYRAKLLFDPKNNDYDDIDTLDQADLIIENWDAFITLASDIFVMNEGFGITRDYSRGHWQTSNATNVDYDNFNTSQDSDTIGETEGDEQEHWQVESRTIDVLNSMSALVRLAIHDCYLLDKDGGKVMSKWGITERVNPRKVTNSILRWAKGSTSLEDLVNKLSAKQKGNPWISQLIARLSDKTGKEADFQSQFWGVFSKPFQLYSVVLLEDGKYTSILVNSRPALREATQAVTTQYKIGEHPLFTPRGINKKLLGNKDTIKPENDFNLHKALATMQVMQKVVNTRELNDEEREQAAATIMGAARILGYPVTEDMASDVLDKESINKIGNALRFIVNSLDKAVAEQNRVAGTGETVEYDPFKFKGENNIGSSLKNFLAPLTDKLEDTAVAAFYDSGKMYQSYVTPSFLTKLMDKFRLKGQEFEDFIMDEYGNSEWFKFPGGGINRGWRNDWLRLLARNESAREVFDHKVELNFNKHNYMRNMTDAEYTLSVITEYFSEPESEKETMVPAWFRMPMLSNKPSSEFIKFYSYRGGSYKKSIVAGLHGMFLQELSRIQTVNMRNLKKDNPAFIKNFDSNGKKFCYLPVFNAYLENSDLSRTKRTLLKNEDGALSEDNAKFAALLQKKVTGLEKLTNDEEAQLAAMVDNALMNFMENKVQSILNTWENNGILEAAKSIKGIGTEDEIVRSNVENFIWNDFYATKNILQLTIGDIAFYKDAEDLQKRLAQLHAPGIRANVTATDYNGNRVSDGRYRTFVLKDLDSYISNIIENLSEVFDRKIAAAPEAAKPTYRALKESLVGENGAYRQINVTDAQGYSSPSSYRKKAFLFGKWSHHAEDIYQKLLKGNYTYTDLETAFQPLKPFVYSHLSKNLGVANAPIQTMNVPFQAKNSEYLLIMADAILQGESLSHPNMLRAVYRVMEESEKLNPTKGIDTVQFESAVKSGLQGRMDITPFRTMPNGEEAAYEYMMDRIYKENADGTRSSDYNTDVYVQETSYDNYCLQQEVPEHFKNHEQSHGSQVRMITPSDLDLYVDPNGDTTDEANKVYYEFDEPDGAHKKLTATEFRQEYEETIAANISDSIDSLATTLHLDSEDKKERNIALSKIIQREILGSPRYGVDLLQACSVDKETGEFRIPKGDPIQAKRIEQLINSIIKNRVNKQEIAGGPIVQVTNFGTSRQLHIRFKDKNGGLLPTREEYESKFGKDAGHLKTEGSATDKFNAKFGRAVKRKTYEEFCKENQAGIAYFEVFVPIWSNDLFNKFANADGTIDIKTIEELNPELLKMIGYRIPTEDKYSSIPMKVVGFMPREAGDAIMQPYEMTTIDGSDHDVDKKYVMRKDIPIRTKKHDEIIKAIWDRIKDETPDETMLTNEERAAIVKDYKEKMKGIHLTDEQFTEGLRAALKQAYYNKPKPTREEVARFVQDPVKYRDMSAWHKKIWDIYKKVAYYTEAPISGKYYRDNKIIDMTWTVLTHERTADKVLNPGGFEIPKRVGYMVAAYRNPANNGITWEQLQNMSIDELKTACYTEKDLAWIDTQVQFYKQNSAAASLIGVFAVNKVAHATLESNGIMLAVNEICGDYPFTVAGFTFGGKMAIDKKYDAEGQLIGKILGSLVGASADAVKDPILNLMNINMTTAGTLCTMLRLGMPFEDAALLLSQDIITRVLDEYNRQNLTGYETLDSIIGKYMLHLKDEYSISDESAIGTEELTREELVEGLTPNDHAAIDYKVLSIFQNLRSLTGAMKKPTFATRFNSISSAVGPLIIDNLILEHKMEQFKSTEDNNTHFYKGMDTPVDIDDVLEMHPILKEFSRTVSIARELFKDMPTGSTGFRNLLDTLPQGLSDKLYNDKSLLNKLSNFYQSYLLMASGMVNPKELKNYVEGFPKWFMKQDYKKKYEGNALIGAIRLNVSKKTGRAFLQINLTGMDAQEKEILSNAWIDLQKSDPELSKRLFIYSFFRAGVGFSPKTFMALVPTYVKERLSTNLSDGSKASYVDTYRKFPSVNPELVIDQFIRNNWDNNKLVPKKGGKGTHYAVNMKQGTLTAYSTEDLVDLSSVDYMKTSINNVTYLWKLTSVEEAKRTYTMIKPLGDNAEYLEMSTENIIMPLSNTTSTLEDETASDIKPQSAQESDSESASESTVNRTEQAKKLDSLIDGFMQQNPKFTKATAAQRIEEIKHSPNQKLYRSFLQNVFSKMGIEVEVDKVLEEFNKYC